MRGWLGELQMSDDAYGFVIDQMGKIVTHPRQDLFRSDVAALEPGNTGLAELAGRIKGEPQGIVRGVDPRTKADASFVFARVPSSNWTFVAVVPHAKR